MSHPAVHHHRRSHLESIAPPLAGTQQEQPDRLAGPRLNRQHLQPPQPPVDGRQHIWQPFDALDQAQRTAGTEPTSGHLDPLGKPGLFAARHVTPDIRGRAALMAVEIRRVHQHMIKAALTQRQRQFGKIGLHHLHCRARGGPRLFDIAPRNAA